jgi:hypothetical protein
MSSLSKRKPYAPSTGGDAILIYSQQEKSKRESEEGLLHCDIAPTFGSLTTETLQEMDDAMRISMGFTLTHLENARRETPGGISWNQLLDILKENPLLVSHGPQISRADKFTRKQSRWFSMDKKPDDAVVKAARLSFLKSLTLT